MNKNIKVLVLLLLVVAGLSSCKGTGDVVPVSKGTSINVVNADTSALNFYQNGTRLDNVSVIAPGSQTGYFNILLTLPLSTMQVYQFKKAGASDYLINNLNLNLDISKSYSIFVAGETADKVFITTDVGYVLPASQAAVRFINASPGTSNFTVTFRDSLAFSNRAFKSATGFANIGKGTAAAKVYLAGSNTPTINLPVTLLPGKFYTLFTKGVPGGTGQNKLSAILVNNN